MRNLLTLCGDCHGLVHRDLVRIEFDGYGRPRFTSRNGVPLHRSKRPQLVATPLEPSLTYANPRPRLSAAPADIRPAPPPA